MHNKPILDMISKYDDLKSAYFVSLSGSRLYGVENENSDFDFIGAFPENAYEVFYNSTKPLEFKDLDLNVEGIIHPFRKFIYLLETANPSLLCLLFANPIVDKFNLLSISNAFVSSRASSTFVGYTLSQLDKLKQSTSTKVSRPELVEKYGYDTKYAGHIVRLCLQGTEFLLEGKMTLPMNDGHVALIKDIRRGAFSIDEFFSIAEYLFKELKNAANKTQLPPFPDHKLISDWLLETYFTYWRQVNDK